MLKKIIFSLMLIIISNNFYSQTYKLVKDYSFENKFGSKDDFISMYFLLDKNSLAKKEVQIQSGTSQFPKLYVPFELVPEIKVFLLKGREKFFEWDSIRKSNNILEMEKQISVFNKKIQMAGDDYGVFIENTEITLNYISWKSGKSVMQLKATISNGVRRDIFAQYLCYGDVEDLTNKNFDLFLNDFTIEFLTAELNKINEKNDLFGK
jgi:hypothetical protein